MHHAATMPYERVTDASERQVQFVATSSDSREQTSHLTGTQLAYGGGALGASGNPGSR
jgi:hypothetical protein